LKAVKKDAKGVTVTFTDKDGKSQTLQAGENCCLPLAASQ